MGTKEVIEQSNKINLLKNNPTIKAVAEIVVTEMLDKVKSELTQKVENSISELLGKISSTEQKISEIELTPGQKGDKGDPGDKPVAGIDYPIPQDGKDYVLTEEDRKEIATLIEVPVVEKVIEKTEVIVEKPIITNEVTNEIREVAKYETPEQIVEKLNTQENAIEQKVIKGLTKWMSEIKRIASSGGGMGNIVTQSFSVNSSTTALTLSSRVASNGRAIWLNYQGQQQAYGTHFTVSGNIVPLLFTPDDGTYIDVLFIRA